MATIPTAYTWTVGEQVTAAKMNAYLRDAVSFLLARPYVRLLHGATQTIATGTATALDFTTEADDADGMHSTTTNPHLVTVQTAGVWTFTVAAPWAANGAGKRECWIRRNGVSIFAADAKNASAAINHAHSVTASFRCSVGDTVEAVVQQTSGGNLNIDNTVLGGQRLTGLWERS